jgi:FkbM family methyltransferase
MLILKKLKKMFFNFKNLIKKKIPYYLWLDLSFFYQYFKFKFVKKYSCRGNIDLILKDIINSKREGFFLEVGAYNGFSESVSLRFENELNWKGLLIEPNPVHFKYLKRNRSKNICLNFICLSQEFLGKKLFLKNLNQMSYIVDDNDKPYFSNYPLEKINNLAKVSLSGNFEKLACKIETLKNIFSNYEIKKIDLAIIDVEGSEIELLKGINFNQIDIEYFCIETYNFERLNKFMTEKNYKFIKKVHREDYVYKKIN